MTGYLLLDQPNPHGDHFYRDRRRPILACVVHITAGLQGKPAGVDSSAEQTARYAATTDRPVSWHSGSDRDSHLRLLPDTMTAWHCKGYNSVTIGHEISKRDVTWADEDPAWVKDTLRQAADCLTPRLQALKIPLRHAGRTELDRAIATNAPPVGLISHSQLDPDRRSDPGADFPWDLFLRLLNTDGFASFYVRPLVRGDVGPDVRRMRHRLGLPVDGPEGNTFTDDLNARVRRIQHARQWAVNGRISEREARVIYLEGKSAP